MEKSRPFKLKNLEISKSDQELEGLTSIIDSAEHFETDESMSLVPSEFG